MPDFAVVTAFKGTDKISPVFKKMSGAADKFGDHASNSFHRASSAGLRLRTVVGGILSASMIQRSARAVWEFGKEAIELASSLNEVQNVVDTTFQSSAKEINNFSKTAIKNFGLSELQAKQFTGSLGAMMKSSGITGSSLVKMSADLSALAGDFASFYNLPIDEAFEKIRSGISGETEPLKRLGINMNVANMEAFALTKGLNKKWKSMTQAEQTVLRYNYLMKVSADSQGDFTKTLKDSYANQKRVFDTMREQAAARAMSKILPLLTQGYAKLNSMLEKFDADKFGEKLRSIVNGFISFLKIGYQVVMILKPFAPIILSIAGAYIAFKKAADIAMGAQRMFNTIMGVNKFQLLIVSVVALIGLILYLKNNWKKLSTSGKVLIITLSGIAAAISGIILYQKIMIAVGYIKYIIMMRGVIIKAIMSTKLWAVAQKALNVIMSANPIGLIIVGVAALIVGIILLIKYWDTVKFHVLDFVDAARMKMLEFSIMIREKVIGALQQMINKFADIPIIGKMFNKVASWQDGILQKEKEQITVINQRRIARRKEYEELMKQKEKQKEIEDLKKSGMNPKIPVIASRAASNDNVSSPSLRAPNESEVRRRKIDFQGLINISGAPDGTQIQSKTVGAPPILMQLLGAQ